MTEEWKSIGDGKDYMISNLGNIKSLDRFVPTIHGKELFIKGITMKPKIDRYGYITIALVIDKKKIYPTIHRLVAKAFIPNPENKAQVNHINGIKKDNRVENLEWCSNLENIRHSVSIGLRDNAPKRGIDCNLSKLKEEDIVYIRNHYNKKSSNLKKLAGMFCVSQGTISLIVRKLIWSHI